LFAAFAAGPVAAQAPETGEMSPVEAAVPQSLLLGFLADPSTFVLIDARSPEEYAESHIDRAINIPHDRLGEYDQSLPEARDGTVVVYCRTGRRAGLLRAQLLERGYTDVRVLQEGQIFSSGDLMVFNCGAQASKSAAASENAAEETADKAREEETER
jgi:rhodanese-related sulfurtransferase